MEIEKRSLPGGGWASGNGRKAAIETTCYALMALEETHQAAARARAMDLLLRTQNPDGSWPAFVGDDREGCWTTALAAITLRFVHSARVSTEKATQWLLKDKGREGHWLWKWKFRTVDRAVQFDPDKYGWPWFPWTVSWVIPTAFALIAIRQALSCCPSELALYRIELGQEMLRDRACPAGGWNVGNGIVFGAGLQPHVDTTAIALLALRKNADPSAVQGLNWLRQASLNCPSPYSLAWSAIAFLVHRDPGFDRCITDLRRALGANDFGSTNIEALSLAAIALKTAQGRANPFRVVI